jgi:colanic acid/amylovoran biosynthesis protein
LKAVITNAVLSNTGDAAIYEAIHSALVSEGVAKPEDISVHDSNARITQDLYPEWTIFQQSTVAPGELGRIRRLSQRVVRGGLIRVLIASSLGRRIVTQFGSQRPTTFAAALRDILSADVVISSGGTYLVDHYNFADRALELRLAKAAGKQVVLWTQSMGPFEAPKARKNLQRISRVTDLAFFRDGKSEAAWARVAIPGAQVATVPDAAFAVLSEPSPLTDPAGNFPKRAILSVRSWSSTLSGEELNFDNYAESMRAIAARLIESGWECVALSTCQGVPGYRVDDAVTAREIFAGLDVQVDGSHHTPAELREILAAADLVISTRMHLAILSLTTQTPVVAVAYEFKTLELFKSLGLGEYAVEIESITSDWLNSRFEKIQLNETSSVLTNEVLHGLAAAASEPARGIAALATR